ncbi:hypothetical protein CRENBAI_024038 [Crenichthys baileyi]|uniref:Uncharacterized protein n=1 Tax=Crenichthys baileyi TaxID=28760 RepID=A0AAV9RFH9_9TELE
MAGIPGSGGQQQSQATREKASRQGSHTLSTESGCQQGTGAVAPRPKRRRAPSPETQPHHHPQPRRPSPGTGPQGPHQAVETPQSPRHVGQVLALCSSQNPEGPRHPHGDIRDPQAIPTPPVPTKPARSSWLEPGDYTMPLEHRGMVFVYQPLVVVVYSVGSDKPINPVTVALHKPHRPNFIFMDNNTQLIKVASLGNSCWRLGYLEWSDLLFLQT